VEGLLGPAKEQLKKRVDVDELKDWLKESMDKQMEVAIAKMREGFDERFRSF